MGKSPLLEQKYSIRSSIISCPYEGESDILKSLDVERGSKLERTTLVFETQLGYQATVTGMWRLSLRP
jgi:hypothetical protein